MQRPSASQGELPLPFSLAESGGIDIEGLLQIPEKLFLPIGETTFRDGVSGIPRDFRLRWVIRFPSLRGQGGNLRGSRKVFRKKAGYPLSQENETAGYSDEQDDAAKWGHGGRGKYTKGVIGLLSWPYYYDL